jgi:hypothetical protein
MTILDELNRQANAARHEQRRQEDAVIAAAERHPADVGLRHQAEAIRWRRRRQVWAGVCWSGVDRLRDWWRAGAR